MKGLITALAAMVLATSAFAAPKFLADKHSDKSITCVQCHGDLPIKPGGFVGSEGCIKCHGNNEQVSNALKAKKELKTDPHYNHMVEINCTACHKGHIQSVNECARCHLIEFDVP